MIFLLTLKFLFQNHNVEETISPNSNGYSLSANLTTQRKIARNSKKYKVPKSTLLFNLKKPGHKETFWSRPISTTEEENTFDLHSSVQIFLNINPYITGDSR